MKFRILASILLSTFCCSTYALRLNFQYDTSVLSFENDSTKSGIFEKIIWEDAFNEADEVGMPELPTFHHTIKMEDNVIVDTVKIKLSKGVSGILTYPIMPFQHPIPTGYPIEELKFVKNERVYQTNSFIPHNCLTNYQVNQAREGKFLSFTVTPFQYNPVTNVYTAYSEAEVEVITHEENHRLYEAISSRDIGIPYYEYVIITTSSLASAFEPFAQWKRAKGYEVGIVNISDILNNPHIALGDTISHIADEAGKLRQYLIYSYNAAQTKYVLLGGDASSIPIRYATLDNIPSDFYYEDLNSNWDLNGNGIFGEKADNIDYGAEIYVGRLLCNIPEEVNNWTKKVLQYEINPGNGDYAYLGRALITQSDHMQQSGDAESFQRQLQGNIDITIFSEYPSYDALHPTSPMGSSVISAINNNHYGILSNFNHGGPLNYGTATSGCVNYAHDAHSGVSAMDAYDDDDNLLYTAKPEIGNGFDNLTNELYPAILYSTSCENMPFDDFNTPVGTFNLGRIYTCRSKGGGPAYLGNTRDGYTFSSPNLYHYFINVMLTNAHFNHLGIAEAQSKFQYQNNYLCHSHNLLGCPEMSLYTRIPSTFGNLVVDNANNHLTISLGDDSIESRICLAGEVSGIYKQYVYTNRSTVVFDTIPDEYTLVVSMPNYIPYIYCSDTCVLQNKIITDNIIYGGCYTFRIGSDITSLQPYVGVTIENGANVTINATDKVIIKNDFEVKLGGVLTINTGQ